MKIYLKSFVVLFFLCGFISPKECTILHSGKFQYIGQDDLYGDIPTFTIQGSKYTEFHEKGNYTIECLVQWINTCELNLTVTKVIGNYNPHKVGDKINLKVTKVESKNIFYQKTEFGATENGKCIKLK